MIGFFRERKARARARRLNRELAEREWSQGKTANAIVFLAISDITCSEITERILALLEGIMIMDSFRRERGYLMVSQLGIRIKDDEVDQMLSKLQHLTGLPHGKLYGRADLSIEDYRGLIRELAALAVQR